MRKDKAKVLDEQWDDARVASFLAPRPGDGATATAYDGADPGRGPAVDHALLLRAYQSMREDDFARFVPLFCKEGRSINARSPEGKTLLELLSEHHYGGPYADILRAHGAVSSAVSDPVSSAASAATAAEPAASSEPRH